MSELNEFRSAAEFGAWLRKNHKTATELSVRIFKVHAADRGMTYAPALDEALSYGWIDGVRRRVDDDSFSIRWCPRKPNSIWSNVNLAHVARLTREGRMQRAGLEVFGQRQAHRTGIYSFEQPPATLGPEYLRRFKRDKDAWKWFEAQAPSYRRKVIHWVMRGRKSETREKRLATLIAASARKVRC
jgi:uncharacterized protein YdeI (YjbR/CyaY-like superfamily)